MRRIPRHHTKHLGRLCRPPTGTGSGADVRTITRVAADHRRNLGRSPPKGKSSAGARGQEHLTDTAPVLYNRRMALIPATTRAKPATHYARRVDSRQMAAALSAPHATVAPPDEVDLYPKAGAALNAMERMTCVSVFSGGMGLDLGLEQAGFSVRFAADNMPAAVETARINRPGLPVYGEDIRSLTASQVRELAQLDDREIDLLAGGPPCQSFSTAGKRLGLDDDAIGPLVFEFVRLVDELRPRAFLMENVKGLTSASVKWRQLPYNNNGKIVDQWHGSLLRELIDRLKAIGYSLALREINSADYGVPQTRVRIFIIGYRDGTNVTFPDPTHARDEGLFLESWRTIKDALSGLGDDDSHCAKFSERKLRYLRMVPPGGNWRDLPESIQQESMGRAFYAKGGRSGFWRRLSFDEPAPTILTEPQNASTALCHPTLDRPLTVRECARIQTFPDDWTFCGRGSDQYRLIGNAVPPLLAKSLGLHIRQVIERQDARAIAS